MCLMGQRYEISVGFPCPLRRKKPSVCPFPKDGSGRSALSSAVGEESAGGRVCPFRDVEQAFRIVEQTFQGAECLFHGVVRRLLPAPAFREGAYGGRGGAGREKPCPARESSEGGERVAVAPFSGDEGRRKDGKGYIPTAGIISESWSMTSSLRVPSARMRRMVSSPAMLPMTGGRESASMSEAMALA